MNYMLAALLVIALGASSAFAQTSPSYSGASSSSFEKSAFGRTPSNHVATAPIAAASATAMVPDAGPKASSFDRERHKPVIVNHVNAAGTAIVEPTQTQALTPSVAHTTEAHVTPAPTETNSIADNETQAESQVQPAVVTPPLPTPIETHAAQDTVTPRTSSNFSTMMPQHSQVPKTTYVAPKVESSDR